MAPSKKIELKLEPPLNGEYYSGEDQISGEVKLTLAKSASVKKVFVTLRAFSETVTKVDSDYSMSQNGILIPGPDSRTYHTIIALEDRVFPPDNVWNALEGEPKPFKLNPGEYTYDFKFEKLEGKRPDCVKAHRKDAISFVKRQDARMPPCFNNFTYEMNKIDNLDIYFYSFGKIIYLVQVAMELGKAKNWFKPFDKVMRETQLIEFIPSVNDLRYPRGDLNILNRNIIFNNTDTPGMHSQSLAQQLRDRNITSIIRDDQISKSSEVPSPNMGTPTSSRSGAVSPISGSTSFIKVHQSTFKVGLPGATKDNNMWLEVRTKNDGLEDLYRRDTIFRKGSNRLDRLYVVFKTSSIEDIQDLNIVPLGIQLNLLETTTFLSDGVANENLSSLRLVGIDFNEHDDSLFSLDELKAYPQTSNVSRDVLTKVECQLKLKDHPSLKRLLFNEENYRHRGNILYSFKACAISRIFDLQLIVDWDINGTHRQTEVIIDNVQVYCQVRPNSRRSGINLNNEEFLPKYVEPPNYGDIAHITVNEDIKPMKNK